MLKPLEGTEKLMGALPRMKPKPHEDMKVKKIGPERPARSAL
jgi:hypothetical protein